MADANLSPVTDCQVIQKLQVPETMDLPEVIPETESKPETVDTANDASDKENELEILEKESTIHPAIYAAEPESKQNHPVATQNTKSVTADENYKTGAAFLSPTAFPSNKKYFGIFCPPAESISSTASFCCADTSVLPNVSICVPSSL